MTRPTTGPRILPRSSPRIVTLFRRSLTLRILLLLANSLGILLRLLTDPTMARVSPVKIRKFLILVLLLHGTTRPILPRMFPRWNPPVLLTSLGILTRLLGLRCRLLRLRQADRGHRKVPLTLLILRLRAMTSLSIEARRRAGCGLRARMHKTALADSNRQNRRDVRMFHGRRRSREWGKRSRQTICPSAQGSRSG